MESKEQTFFSKVSTRKERERIFVLLVESKSHIDCQFQNKKVYSLVANHIKDSHLVVFCDQLSIQSEQPVILSFHIGQEKYFCKTNLSRHDFQSHFKINLDTDIFKLQRRNAFRVSIPSGYSAKTSISKIHTQEVKNIRFNLLDLSGGGFSFEITPEKNIEFVQGQTVEGQIQIGGKFQMNYIAVIRYSGKTGSQGSGLKKIGLEFLDIKPKEREEIIQIVMEIHRDIFSKFKIGSR